MVVDTGDYWLVRFLFLRGLALIYLIAFVVAARQFRPLAGEDGLLPFTAVTERSAVWERPSIFHHFDSDTAVRYASWSGVVIAASALLGIPDLLGTPAVVLAWGVMWVLYLSLVNVGRLFYGYGWESLLLETGFLAIFLGGAGTATPDLIVWLLRWVLFRVMFGAGLIKLRGDQCWRDLTCMEYHYETQPMPNPLSWFFHHAPRWLHKVETLGNHIVELVVPFLYFAPQPVAAYAGGATILFQGWLMLSGNFSWLNTLTMVLAVSTFNDAMLSTFLPIAPMTTAAPSMLHSATVWAVTGLVLLLSINPVRNMLSAGQKMNAGFDPFHLVNTYGAFGSITKTRYQLVIEATQEEDPDEEDWEPYITKGQPVRLDELPPQWAPYHLRLDWQLWFAAMRPRPPRWVHRLVQQLLAGDEAAESLFRAVPFDEPPEQVRIRRFHYRFTTPSQRSDTGDWWTRTHEQTFLRPVTADEAGERARPVPVHNRLTANL